MYIDRIRIDWDKVREDSFLTRIPAICLLQELAFRKPVTFFVGENGTGKSTLLEAIAIAYGFNPEGGTLNYNFSTHDDYSELCDALTIAQGAAKGRRGGFFLRAEMKKQLKLLKESVILVMIRQDNYWHLKTERLDIQMRMMKR